jgi:hypothetical protein
MRVYGTRRNSTLRAHRRRWPFETPGNLTNRRIGSDASRDLFPLGQSEHTLRPAMDRRERSRRASLAGTESSHGPCRRLDQSHARNRRTSNVAKFSPTNQSIGVSTYKVTRELQPPIQSALPTIEDLEEVVLKLRSELASLRRDPTRNRHVSRFRKNPTSQLRLRMLQQPAAIFGAKCLLSGPRPNLEIVPPRVALFQD